MTTEILFAQILPACDAVATRCEVALLPSGLTLAQVQALSLLEREACNQQALARGLGRHNSNVSALVRAMEKAGLVRRQRRPQNEREVRVSLTSTGHARLQDARKLLDHHLPDLGLHELAQLLTTLPAVSETP